MADEYLADTAIVDWTSPAVRALAQELNGDDGPCAIAGRCFRWVRDEVRHSGDHGDRTVSLTASETLAARTGLCYAKSHLLVALLRANAIPAGFGYQRLSVDDEGRAFCLHGIAAVRLPAIGWDRADARGNRPGVVAEFDPPREKLAFQPQLPGEQTFAAIMAEPLPAVVTALREAISMQTLLKQLPDWTG